MANVGLTVEEESRRCGVDFQKDERADERQKSSGPWKEYKRYCEKPCGRVKRTLQCEKTMDKAGPQCDKKQGDQHEVSANNVEPLREVLNAPQSRKAGD